MAAEYGFEDLGGSLSIIPLEEEEEPAVQYDRPLVDDAEVDTRWSIVGRFLTDSPIDFMAMENLMAVLWKPGMGMYVKDLGANRFIFQFYHEIDIQRVIDRSPWTFKNAPLISERLKTGDIPRALRLHHLEIWVQLHDIQAGFKTERVVSDAANYIGSFVKTDENNFNGVWREYLRVQVRIDIEKPLKRRMKLQLTGGEWFWINFCYEFVPTFCFICGVIGHTDQYCSRLFIQPIASIVKPYGSFMKAVPRRTQYAMGSKWLRLASGGAGNFGASASGGVGSSGTSGHVQQGGEVFQPRGDRRLNAHDFRSEQQREIPQMEGQRLMHGNRDVVGGHARFMGINAVNSDVIDGEIY
ncbi:uncharacterized protein LOC133031289 [Cannabis sativa]|uniref:uncharacterized protein LOC133031289 n=1 Tax=Cannabis sativa TaxID=3483 RepID=UPI0029CA87BB|nr:uncharacterized protein LOC133031289 [Cannabis sativa]